MPTSCPVMPRPSHWQCCAGGRAARFGAPAPRPRRGTGTGVDTTAALMGGLDDYREAITLATQAGQERTSPYYVLSLGAMVRNGTHGRCLGSPRAPGDDRRGRHSVPGARTPRCTGGARRSPRRQPDGGRRLRERGTSPARIRRAARAGVRAARLWPLPPRPRRPTAKEPLQRARDLFARLQAPPRIAECDSLLALAAQRANVSLRRPTA